MNRAPEGQHSEPDYSIPGLRIRPCDPPDPWALEVKCSERQQGWIAYQPREHHMDRKVETIIHYADQYYRIQEEERTDRGWVYRLNPLPRGEPLVNVVELTREELEKKEQLTQERRKADRLDRIAPFYEVLIGFLPARILEELSLRWGFDPEEASRKNAFIEMGLGFGVTIIVIAVMLSAVRTGAGSNKLIINAILCFSVALDGAIRWAHVQASNKPLGFLILEAADRLIQLLRRR
jgi:hypothetical protein